MTYTKDQLTQLLTRLETLDATTTRLLLAGLKEDTQARCAQDGLFWLRFVKTRDEADAGETIKPFPVGLPYIQPVWDTIHQESVTIIAKSRQMLMSWVLAAYGVWLARYHPNVAVYWQTKTWDDAIAAVSMPEGGVMGRCQFIEAYLPDSLKVEHKPSEGRIQYSNGSLIQALAGGGAKIRGKTASLVIEDEFAHQDDQDGVYRAVAPLIQKGAKAVFVSSPNGAANTFATLYHGRPVGESLEGVAGASPS